MGSDASYNERRFLWKAVRFVCAVTGMRRTPRPMGANCTRVQTAARRGCRLSLPGGPARFYAHLPHPRRAGILWEVIRSIMNGGFYRE